MLLYLRTSKTASSTVNDWLGPDHSQNVTHNIRRFGNFNPKNVEIDYKSLLTKERKDKIYETHKEDFKAFDYSKTIDF